MNMKILMFPRGTEDWDNLDPKEYRKRYKTDGIETYQQRVLTWTEDDIQFHDINLRLNMDLWYKKRKLPFVKYRAELKHIARKTWEKANLESYNFEEKSNDLILIPIDDDDWVAPTIKEELLQAFSDPKISIAVWDHWTLNTIHNRWDYHVATSDEMIWSCTYAIRSSISNLGIEHSHMLVQEFMQTVPYTIIHKPLSIYQLHPGSTCSLWLYPFSEFKGAKNIPHPPDLLWGFEETEELYKLLLKIKPPHKIF